MQKQASTMLFIAIMMGMTLNSSLQREDVAHKRITITKYLLGNNTDVTVNSSFNGENVTTGALEIIRPKQLAVARNLVKQYCEATMPTDFTLCIRDLSDVYIEVCGLKGVYAYSTFFYAILSSKRCPRFKTYMMKKIIKMKKRKPPIQMRNLIRENETKGEKSNKSNRKKKGRAVCVRRLYDRYTQICCGGKIRKKKHESDKCCHKTIYNLNTHRDRDCCGKQLYNITTHVCAGKKKFIKTEFCKSVRSLRHNYTVDSHECCHNQLIDVRSHICCNGVTWPLSENNNTCCGKVLYDRTLQFCRSKKVYRKARAYQNVLFQDPKGFRTSKKVYINTTLQKTAIKPTADYTHSLPSTTTAKEIETPDTDGRNGINKREKGKSSDAKANSNRTATITAITVGCVALVVVFAVSSVLVISYRSRKQKPPFPAGATNDSVENSAYKDASCIAVGWNLDTLRKPREIHKHAYHCSDTYSDHYRDTPYNTEHVLFVNGQNETLDTSISNQVPYDKNERLKIYMKSRSEVVMSIEENSDVHTSPFETVNKIDCVELVKEAQAPHEEDVKVCSISLIGHAATYVVQNPSTSFSEPMFPNKTQHQQKGTNNTNNCPSDGKSDFSYTSELTLNLSQFQCDILEYENDVEDFNNVQPNFLEHIYKTSNVKDTNLTKNLFKECETQTMPFKKINKLDSFGNPFDYNSVMSIDQRTVQLPYSEVKMTLPIEDLRQNKIECFASSFSDIGAIGRKLALSNSENLVSPAVEFCLQGEPYLSKHAVIKMPIVGMIGENIHAWRVVSDEGEKDISIKIEVPIVGQMDESLDTFCIISQTKSCGYIYTKVFSWYVFTYDGQIRKREMVMKAWLYGKMRKCAVNELSAEVCLYLLDTLYDLKDFNHVITKQTEKSGHKLLANVRPLDMSQNIESCDELMLQLRVNQPWRFMIDEMEPEFDSSRQSVTLHEIVSSQTTPYPYCCVWNLETVNDASTVLKAFVYVTFQRSGTEGLSSQELSMVHRTRFDVLTSLEDQESDGIKEATAKAICSSTRRLNGVMVNRLTQQIIMYSCIAKITSTSFEDILLELQMKQDTDTFIERIVASLHDLKLHKVIRSLNDVGIIPDNMLPVRPELEKRPPCSFDGRGNPLRNYNIQSKLSESLESFEDSCKSKQHDIMRLDKNMPHGELSRSPQCSYNTASNPPSDDMNRSGNECDKTSCTTTTKVTHLSDNRALNSNTYPRLTKQTFNSNRENTKGDAKGMKDCKSENAIYMGRECQISPVFFPPQLGVLVGEEGGDTTEDRN